MASSLERRVAVLEREIMEIKKFLEFEELSEDARNRLEERIKNPDFVPEEEFWREAGVED